MMHGDDSATLHYVKDLEIAFYGFDVSIYGCIYYNAINI